TSKTARRRASARHRWYGNPHAPKSVGSRPHPTRGGGYDGGGSGTGMTYGPCETGGCCVTYVGAVAYGATACGWNGTRRGAVGERTAVTSSRTARTMIWSSDSTSYGPTWCS